MATKIQAKAAVDSAGTSVKADIDATLPTGVNITDGDVQFAPTGWRIKMTAPDLTTAQSWRDTILTNLAAASRTATVTQTLGRRGGDGERFIAVHTVLADYVIVGF